MSHKATQRTGCSNAEEELLTYADEVDILSHAFKLTLPHKIEAWNELEQKVDCLPLPKTSFTRTRRSQSVMAKEYSSTSTSESASQVTKQELKFKLKHYEDQIAQPVALEIEDTYPLIAPQKQDYVSGCKLRGFQRAKKLKNFSISQPKHKTIKQNKTPTPQQPRRSLNQTQRKQKELAQLRTTFYPLTASFQNYQQQQKLAQTLKQYFKKRTYGMTL